MPNVDANWQSFNSSSKIHGKTEKNPPLSLVAPPLLRLKSGHTSPKKWGAYQSPFSYYLPTYKTSLLAQWVTKVKLFKKLS